MTAAERAVLKAVGIGLLYVLASPILLLKLLLSIQKQLGTIARIRSGMIACEWCGADVNLNRVARCATCHATTPGSLLRCSMCGASYRTVTCDACQSTVRVR
ncbi:MAG: hypothetical protein AABO58_00730 [Acidobacteriota bacterium]